MSESGVYVDVLTAEAKSKGQKESLVFVQRFQPFWSGEFKLLGAPMVIVGKTVVSQSEAAALLARFQTGIQTHAEAAKHWSEWSAR